MTETRWDPQPNTEVLVPPRYDPITEWVGRGNAWGVLTFVEGGKAELRTLVVVKAGRLSVLSTEGGAVLDEVGRRLDALRTAGEPAETAAEKAVQGWPRYFTRDADLAELSKPYL